MVIRTYFVKTYESFIYLSILIFSFLGILVSIIFYYFLAMALWKVWLNIFSWNVLMLLSVWIFRRCMLYQVSVESDGIRLYYTNVCDFVIDANYRDIMGRRVKNKRRKIKREKGWLFICWRDIKSVEVNRRGNRKCIIELHSGHRVYLLNNVDWEIRKAVKEAWEKWKARSKEDLNKKKG